ncbi:hypothetical protein J4209_00425 [Candidatus Woesearchaeota archaeon]|nr:hypothetical protein [Candidatus Woesearchaeota archaeon]
MGKIAFLALFFLLFVNIAYAATIYGEIYDISLDKVEGVIVEINTLPNQQYVSKNGTYAFNVPVGDYTIKANYYLDNILESSTAERISVKTEGNFRLDLILFPSFEEENNLLNGTELDIAIFEEKPVIWPYILIILLIILLIIFYYLKKGKKKKIETKEEKVEEKKEEIKEEKKEILATDLSQILKIIKEEGGRATQKEIRKKIPLSEAKISLMIAELEHEGKIKKIKKGRGNIIILR